MADITMCKGTKESICVHCYRKNATHNEYRQSYFLEIPIKSDGTCPEYWVRVKGYHNRRKMY